MVSTSEGLLYYCTVFLTAIVFLTEASAITTNYEKSTTSNKTNASSSQDVAPQRTKLAPARGRGNNLSKNQNQDRVAPLTLTKLKTNPKPETVPHDKAERELLVLSNSGGDNDVKDKGGASATDDDQKTLSQQVADGKYGLIQDEIFTIKPERQGIISYDVNPEVPKDNINNLGGLEPDDIWLAENHLLVLAGGGLNEMQTQWRPIDNYVAPNRPVQLPLNPKVPPPFPVQLSENGPIEYLKSSRPQSPYMPFFNPLLMQHNFSKGYGSPQYGKIPYGGTIPPLKSPLKPSLPYDPNAPLPPPIYVKPPPGSEFIPPYLNTNITEADEDDPSLYYPPPYDFYYPKDNTSRVPPGPLVPGIVLPPPPNFFTLISNQTKSKETKPLPVDQKPPKPGYKTGKQLHYPLGEDARKPSTKYPLEPPTFITYDDIINEVTYPDTNDDKITYADVKVNKVSTEDVSEDWIPIPAPKPFYITGEKKPIKSTLLVMMEKPDLPGYNYEKPKTSLKPPKKPSLKYLHFPDTPIGQLGTTTPIAPQLVSPKSSTHNDVYTTTPIPAYQPPQQTIKATYYFYEEPRFTDVEPARSHFSTSSPLPATSILEFNDYIPSKQPALNISSDKKRKPIKPMIPIYYLAELENLVDLVKPMNLPYPTPAPQPPKTEYYTSTAKPTYTINKPNYERPTSKPIFEYNYVASDYNSDQNQHSTPSPINYDHPAHYPIDYHPFYNSASYQLFNPVAQYDKPAHTTVNPILYLHNHYPQNGPYGAFDRPWVPNVNLYNHIPYPTENPYYAFFTKEEEDLIDDNTKKYFTIFGQKIKQNVEATTPLSVHAPASGNGAHWASNYEYGSFPSQSSTSGRLSFAPTTPAHAAIKKPPSATGYKPPSLAGDTLVNYVTPLPAENVDAEYVTPKISKHIRPIVVEDLPPDVHERLKNIMNLQRQTPTASGSRMRYVLVDHEYDGRSHPQNSLNTFGGKYGRPEGGSTDNSLESGIHDDYHGSRYTTEKYRRPEGGSTPISLESDIRVNYISNHGGRYTTERYRRPEGGSTPISLESDIRTNYLSNQGGRYTTEKYRRPEGSSTPISLESDIRVNYQSNLPTNPDAEYVQGGGSQLESKFHDSEERGVGGRGRHKAQESRSQKPISLENDILVNYKNKGRYTTTDPDAEYVGSGERGNPVRGGSSSNVISYRYPGVEHGHFYFLTPQETRLTHIENERYDFQSDVEKPSSYFKRVPRKLESSTNSTAKI